MKDKRRIREHDIKSREVVQTKAQKKKKIEKKMNRSSLTCGIVSGNLT